MCAVSFISTLLMTTWDLCVLIHAVLFCKHIPTTTPTRHPIESFSSITNHKLRNETMSMSISIWATITETTSLIQCIVVSSILYRLEFRRLLSSFCGVAVNTKQNKTKNVFLFHEWSCHSSLSNNIAFQILIRRTTIEKTEKQKRIEIERTWADLNATEVYSVIVCFRSSVPLRICPYELSPCAFDNIANVIYWFRLFLWHKMRYLVKLKRKQRNRKWSKSFIESMKSIQLFLRLVIYHWYKTKMNASK